MRNKLYLIIALLIFAFAQTAMAHPLGNFSVNQYSRLEVGKSQIKVRQILDLAEIPTFQETGAIDTDKNGALSQDELNAYAEKITPQFLANLFLSVNNQPLELRADNKKILLKEGAGGLSTLRIEWNLIADVQNLEIVSRVKFENKNYADRIGWNEIVVNRQNGVNVFDSTAKGSGVTNEIESYPQDTLAAPLHERAAEFSFTTKAIPENAALLQDRDGHTTAVIIEKETIKKDKLAELINVPEITPAIALFGLLIAFGLGAVHAMSPGHGKTVVGAYLVGSRGTIKHAAFLGLTVTITHTLGVFALGLITLFASNYILPERLMPFLNFVSGLLVFFIGISLFKDRLFAALGWKKEKHHDHSHDEHGHQHSHGEHVHHQGDSHLHESHSHHARDASMHTHDGVHYHSHLPPEEISWKSLLALGISGGLLPCPSALVLMLSAISLGRTGYGMILTLAFSFGLAATLAAVGLVFLYVGKAFGGSKLAENRIVKTLPAASAFVIAVVGAVICYNSLG
ncbi:MAG: sulfite exporter TauE/SafE family protein [Pyrinomonadaceae bacterium]